MSQQKLDSRRQQNTAVCSLQSLSAPGREWGTALRAGNSSTGSTKSESNLSVGFPNSFVNKKKGLEALASSCFACFFLLWRLCWRGENERKAR